MIYYNSELTCCMFMACWWSSCDFSQSCWLLRVKLARKPLAASSVLKARGSSRFLLRRAASAQAEQLPGDELLIQCTWPMASWRAAAAAQGPGGAPAVPAAGRSLPAPAAGSRGSTPRRFGRQHALSPGKTWSFSPAVVSTISAW